MRSLVSSDNTFVISGCCGWGCAGRGARRNPGPRTAATLSLQLVRPGEVESFARIFRDAVERRRGAQRIRQPLELAVCADVHRPSWRETKCHVETEAIARVAASIVVDVIRLLGLIVPQAAGVRKSSFDRVGRADTK